MPTISGGTKGAGRCDGPPQQNENQCIVYNLLIKLDKISIENQCKSKKKDGFFFSKIDYFVAKLLVEGHFHH